MNSIQRYSVLCTVPLALFATITTAQNSTEATGDTGSMVFFQSADDLLSYGSSITEMREQSTESFNLLDVDENGWITYDELLETAELFDEEDSQPENYRTHRQRFHSLQRKFLNRQDEDFNVFEVADTNQDGFLNEEEFEMREINIRNHRLKLAFDELDTNSNGSLDLIEFNAHLEDLENLDTDGDGRISMKEAIKSKNSQYLAKPLISEEMINVMVKDMKGSVYGDSELMIESYSDGENVEVKTEIIRMEFIKDKKNEEDN